MLRTLSIVCPRSQVISSFDISHHQYADDTQLYIALDNTVSGSCIDRLQQCSCAVHNWFLHNGLSLNPSKSDVTLFDTTPGLQSMKTTTRVCVAGVDIDVSKSTKILGVTLDQQLNYESHVNAVCKSCYRHIKTMRHIRPSLTTDVAKIIACSITGARLDYCNALLYDTSSVNLNKLQRVQNMLARVVTNTRRFEHITPVLAELHWLRIPDRITYKTALLTRKVLLTGQPEYLCKLLRPYIPTRSLRSASHQHLTLPDVRLYRSRVSSRAFCVAAPTVWNSLPPALTDMTATLGTFKKHLKTHLFELSLHG